MKLLLNISFVLFLSLNSLFSFQDEVDISGIYKRTASYRNTKIVIDQIHLGKDNRFVFEMLIYEGFSSRYTTSGTYTLQGAEIRFYPEAFTSQSDIHKKQTSNIKRGAREWQTMITIDKKSPEQFQNLLSTFEAGLTRLQPRYIIKQPGATIYLCLEDTKSGLFCPIFKKAKPKK